MAVRWYLRYGLSYRDVEELLAERCVAVDHVTVYRWVQRFTPLFADAARPRRPTVNTLATTGPQMNRTVSGVQNTALDERRPRLPSVGSIER